MKKITNFAHTFLAEVINQNDIVIDATMGNGHDTEFLALYCDNVFAFDIQQQAIDATHKRLEPRGLSSLVTTILDSHENVDKYVTKPIKAAIFNLGYLPGSDKTIITKPDSTILALDKISKMMVCGGRIAITIYPGHEGGQQESNAVSCWAKNLDMMHFHVAVCHNIHKTHSAPYVLLVQKL